MARLRAFLVLIALGLLAAPAASADGWLPAEDVATFDGTPANEPELAGLAQNDRGDAVITWADAGGVHAAVSRRGGPFGAVSDVSGSASGARPEVALNEDGRGLIRWLSGGKVVIVGLKVDGGFGHARPIPVRAQSNMAIGPAGRFTFTYPGHRFEDLYARSAPPSGKLGPARLVASGQVSTAALWYQGTQPRVLYGLGQEDYQRLRERRIGAGGPSRVVADHLPNAPRYAVDTASNGVQVAAWSSYPGSNAKEPLVVGIRRPGRAFKVQQLDFRVPPETLDVAAAPSGAAEIAWGEWNPPTDDDPPPTPEYAPGGRIVTAYRPADGPFGAPQAFRPDPDPSLVAPIHVKIDSAGTAALSWGARTLAGGDARLYAAIQRSGGDPVVTRIAGAGYDGGPGAEIDEHGRSVFTWIAAHHIHTMRGHFAP